MSRSRSPSRPSAYSFFAEELSTYNDGITRSQVVEAWMGCPLAVKKCFEGRFSDHKDPGRVTRDPPPRREAAAIYSTDPVTARRNVDGRMRFIQGEEAAGRLPMRRRDENEQPPWLGLHPRSAQQLRE